MSASSADLRDLSGQLVLVGAGKMGGALLEGWLRLGLDPAQVAVIEPKPSPQIAALAERGVRLNPDAARAHRCRRHRHRGEAANRRRGDCRRIAPLIGTSTVVVSIMAGRTLQFLAAALPGRARIVRAMPNTPAAIGRGITVAVPCTPTKRSARWPIGFCRRPEQSSGSMTRL